MSQPETPSLERFPAFAALGAAEAAEARKHLELTRLKDGAALFFQGDPGEHVYLLEVGEIELRVKTARGETALATLHPGALFGEISLLTRSPRTATAVAMRDAVLWRLSLDRFAAALTRGEVWARVLLLAMAQVLAERLATMNRRVVAQLEQAAGQDDNSMRELERLRDQILDSGLYQDLLFT